MDDKNIDQQQQYNNEYDDNGTYETGDKEFIKEQLDVSKDLEDFEHRVLRGEIERLDPKKGMIWVKCDPNANPVMNEVGVRELIGRLMGYVNKTTKMSFYKEEEIMKNMFYFDMSLSELVAKRCDDWDMDMETAKSIKDACIELVQSILFCSRNGFTAMNMKTQYMKQDITKTDSNPQKSNGLFGIFKK